MIGWAQNFISLVLRNWGTVRAANPHEGPAILLARARARIDQEEDGAGKKQETEDPPRELKSLIDNHIDGFNTQNIELFLGVFGDTAIIIDGIAPYRWLNPNAPANWLADVEKWRKGLGVSYEHLSYEMGFWNVEESVAYAVIAGTLTVTISGQTVTRTGTLAYTFSKHGGEWKIDAQAWGRTS